MTLDLETLYFASAISRCAYLVVFLVTALRQPGERYLWHWIGALVSSMVGLAILSRIPPTEDLDLPSAVLIYGLCVGSLSLSWSGLRLFHGRQINMPVLGTLTLVPALAYVAIVMAGLSAHTAVICIFAACMLLTGLSIRETLLPSQSEQLWSQYVVAVAFLGYFLIFGASIVMSAVSDLETRTVESGLMSMVIDQVTGILIYFGYLAMAGERASLGLRRLAEIDSLTGLFNRRGLESKTRGRTMGSQSGLPTGVLLADIDHFKSVNDTHGHQAGDAVLKGFSERMKSALRAEDILVRWGGEEFLALLPGAGIDQSAAIAERLRSAIEAEPFAIASGSIRVTVSVGITEIGWDEHTIEQATRRADAALYTAKTTGRNRVGRSDDATLPSNLGVLPTAPSDVAAAHDAQQDTSSAGRHERRHAIVH